MRLIFAPLLYTILLSCLALVLLPAFCATPGADKPLDLDLSQVEAAGVDVTPTKTTPPIALHIVAHHKESWPGIILKASGGHWDLSPYEYLALQVRNTGSNSVEVVCRVDNPGADGTQNCLNGRVTVKPGETADLKVPLDRNGFETNKGKLFGMRGYPAEAGISEGIDVSNIIQLVIFTPRPTEDHTFDISNIHAGGSYTAPRVVANFFPFIDTFGQYIYKDWPGKIHSQQDLAAHYQAEANDLRSKPGPEGWDRFGGWAAGPSLPSTGFFRTQKYQEKWWLVDPDGRLFFSHGMDAVRPSDGALVDKRAAWFQNFPGSQPEFKEFASVREESGENLFSFTAANLKRKYGADWKRQYAEITHRRLRSWGMNTIGNWSDPAIYLQDRTPYVVGIDATSKLLEGSTGYWRKFADVFDPDFRIQLQARMVKETGKSAGDPWCIGYFVDNELSWGSDTSLAEAALASPPTQAAKKIFIQDLKAKYGTIEKLNNAWGSHYTSWDDLLQARKTPDTTLAHGDLVAFYQKLASQYFKTCREVMKQVAPHQLYLGCRFASVNDSAAEAAAQYCDVVSYNLYRQSVADFRFPGKQDVPLIIGEFHFGALDRGLFHPGLVPMKDQAARAGAYKSYVQGVLKNPAFVGCHWFEYKDEPTTGRWDGENYQIGFLDVADTPYRETVEACREAGYGMYHYRLEQSQG